MLKSARHPYFPIFPWILDKLRWKKLALVWTEILRLFVNKLTAVDRYYRRNMQNFLQQLQTTLSQKKKTFSDFLLILWNVLEI